MPARQVDAGMLDSLGDQMVGEVRAYLAHHGQPVICLSGGYDSRLILAALDEIGRRPIGLTSWRQIRIFAGPRKISRLYHLILF